ncbi:MAG: hypothetical protein ABIP94_06215 [Planctomycetota bacterium]
MKLPIPLLLYLAAAGLFGLAGWTFYETLPLWKESVRQAATRKGQDDASERIQRGKGQGPVLADWQYTPEMLPWWERFKDVNLIGKLPPAPVEEASGKEAPPPPPPPVRPLEEIIELVSIVYDGQALGRGGNSYVIVRYKDVEVEPPEWYVRENQPASAAGTTNTGTARDSVPLPGKAGPARAQRPPPGRPITPMSSMPASTQNREIQQKVWAQGDGDPRQSSFLWPKFSDIRLVRVASDAQSAFFIRTPHPPAAGVAPTEPKEEELLKTAMNLSQDVLHELRRLQGRGGEPVARGPDTSPAANAWREVEETTRFGNEIHLGRKDEARFRDEDIEKQVNLDTWQSRESNLTGLIVRNIDPQLKAKLGIAEGEVLLEVNGKAVTSKAQAMQFGKADYKRGVRSFATKWLANGQIVERVYQAPNK